MSWRTRDRKLLTEPVRQALAVGTPLNIGRRALPIRSGATASVSIELSAASIRMETGESVGAVLLMHDVTEVRGLARQMSYQATHDALTGLLNRRDFERRLRGGHRRAHRGDSTHVLCYLDLDRFKSINDSSGHQAGDAMLREAAKLLRDAVRDSDTVARIGGDEFGMLLVGCPLDKARQIADDVCRAVTDFRFVWRDKIFNVGVSIGLVEISRDSGSIEELLAAADSACYVAKRQGGHVAVYSARDEAFARQSGEIHWLQTLQVALRDSRFELYCQPIVASYASNDEGPAMEVLVRLRNELGEQLVPLEFLRAAERYRLMGFIDRWVVRTTLTALGRGAIELAAQAQHRHQYLRPDSGRCAIPRIRGRVFRFAPAPIRRRSVSRSPKARWLPISSRRAASSAYCTAWAVALRSMISAAAWARSPISRPSRSITSRSTVRSSRIWRATRSTRRW